MWYLNTLNSSINLYVRPQFLECKSHADWYSSPWNSSTVLAIPKSIKLNYQYVCEAPFLSAKQNHTDWYSSSWNSSINLYGGPHYWVQSKMILNRFASVKGDTEDVLWSSCRKKNNNLHLICIALESLCITVYNEQNLCVLEFILMFFSDRYQFHHSFRKELLFID